MNARFSQLPKYVQWIFTGLEFLSGFVLIVLLAILVFGGKRLLTSADAGGMVDISLDLGEIAFSIPPESYSIISESLEAENFVIEDAMGKVSVHNPKDVDGFMEIFLAPMVVLILLGGGLVIAILECFRRLFRNVRRGDSFDPVTVSLLHKVGGLIIALEVGATCCSAWMHLRISQFLRDNLKIEGLETDFVNPGTGSLKIGWGETETSLGINVAGILAGVMILAIGEAFRQGVLLKKENELTI